MTGKKTKTTEHFLSFFKQITARVLIENKKGNKFGREFSANWTENGLSCRDRQQLLHNQKIKLLLINPIELLSSSRREAVYLNTRPLRYIRPPHVYILLPY